LLCSILRSTGVAGRPGEYFFCKRDETWEERWGSPSRVAYVERVFQRYTTPNGVFGFVLMWAYFDRVIQMLQEIPENEHLNGTQLLAAVFNQPKYIWMRRRDRVQQAVSWAMASQTKVWAKKMGETPQPRAEPQFDFDLIDERYNGITADELSWENYFRKNQIDPLILFYEDVIASNRDAAARVLEFLGVSFPSDLEMATPTVEKQATSISEQWAASYLKLKRSRIAKLSRALRRVRTRT
jgi:trehalose 2-sulfotransferase